MTKKKTSATKRRTQAKSSATRGGTRSRKKPTSSTRKKTTGKRSSSSSKRSSKRRSSRSNPPAIQLDPLQKTLIIGIAIVFATAVLALSLLSPNQGQLTQALSGMLWQAFGWGGAIFPLITGSTGLYLIMRGMEQEPELPGYRLLGGGILLITFLLFASITAVWQGNGLNTLWEVAEAGRGGGYIGGGIAYIFTEFLGDVGTLAIFFLLGIVGAILLTGMSRAELAALFQQGLEGLRLPPSEDDLDAPPLGQPQRNIRLNPRRRRRQGEPQTVIQPPLIDEELLDGAVAEQETAVLTPPKPAIKEEPKPEPKIKPRRRSRRRKTEEPKPEVATPVATPEPIVLGKKSDPDHHWVLPSVDELLLSGSNGDVNNSSLRQQVELIEHTLDSFGAPATVVEINQGPTITQFGVEPNYIESRSGKRTKVKVGKIASLADDLALALAARSIRIQAPVPGKGYIGIEVPNIAKALVSLRDVMESEQFGKLKSPLRIGLGENVAGTPVAADLASMPHMLVAGTTGSGKSVCINGIIACLLLQNTPDDLKLVMVDPKRVELTGYNGIPHLAAPVVVEMDRVVGTLQWALREMDTRYKMFAQVGARSITDYNKKIKNDKERDKLPYIVIIIDELADLMMLAPEETERSIARLAQMARATGIHMVIATQRPSVNVVTGLIKANFPARIAFTVASGTDSRVILDTTGAERLLGAGDMLFQSPDAGSPVRLQGCFVSNEELNNLIAYWRRARQFNLISADEVKAPKKKRKSKIKPPVAQVGSSVIAEQPTPTPAELDKAKPVPPPVINPSASRGGVRDADAETAVMPTPKPTKPAKAKPTNGRSATPPPPPEDVPLPFPDYVSEPTSEDFIETIPVIPTPAPPPPEEPPVEEPVEQSKPKVRRRVSKKKNGKETAVPERQPLWEALEEVEEQKDKIQYDDELMPEAIALVRKLNKASTSLLQRRFRIGYTRAARLMDIMEDQNIIGPPTGTSKARDVMPVEPENEAEAESA